MDYVDHQGCEYCLMWRIPAPLIAGGGAQSLYFTSDTWIGDLWTYMGSPSQPVTVLITADAADVGGIYVSADFTAGSTFQIDVINGGRLVGEGGNGGAGGDDLGASATSGTGGVDGGHALASEGWVIDVDLDDGFLLGGGGGGGGGSGADRGATADAGGGGGGGQGFNGGTGGAGGSGSTPVADDGTAGSVSAPGAGGGGGGVTAPFPDGGGGGNWGESGTRGYHQSATGNIVKAGIGGAAGNAFGPISGSAAINYIGALTEAQLRTAGRISGETEGFIKMHSDETAFGADSIPFTLGWQWAINGVLTRVNSDSGNTVMSGYYWRDTLNGTATANYDNTLYEIVQDSATEASGSGWDAEFPTQDAYYALNLQRTLSITDAAFLKPGQVVRIRRVGEAGDLAMGFYSCEMENLS